jgi:putative hemolysin
MGWLIAGCILYFLMVVAEKALIAVTPHELEMLRAEGTPSARRVVALADSDSRRALAAVALGKLLSLVGTVIGLLNFLLHRPFFQKICTVLEQNLSLGNGALPLVAIITAAVVSLFFWQIDQIDLRNNPNPIARFWLQRLSPFILFAHLLFRPFLPKDKKKVPTEPAPSAENTPISQLQDTGKRDIEMLKSIAKFGDVTVRQVMQAQPKIVGLDSQLDFGEVLQRIRTSDFSRLPVYEGDLDNVLGTLYVKDIVDLIEAPHDYPWMQRVRPDVFIVPETKPVAELLRAFKQRRLHLALVVDEYGGTSGLVTMEDILEEVTGEIRDEFDEENDIPPYRQIGPGHFSFSGTTMLNDVCHIAGLDPSTFDDVREDADTIAGLALHLVGDIPKPGQEVRWGQYRFVIQKADHRRIEEIVLVIAEE